ncbi:hypothetical protein UAY_02395, partial [Enterococcus moraviensis ATCC BAA-383]
MIKKSLVLNRARLLPLTITYLNITDFNPLALNRARHPDDYKFTPSQIEFQSTSSKQ